ncbi:MAG: Mur ligase family protein [Alphaproteobacteria bacterium]
MIRVPGYEGRQVAVFGLGRPGLAAARALARSGAQVLAWDDAGEARRRAAEAGLPLRNLAETPWRDIDTLVLSPDMPRSGSQPHPVILRAREAGAEIVCDIDLFLRALGPRGAHRAGLVAVTGSRGASATTALTAHLLGEAGHLVHTGGNTGIPVLDLPEPDAGRIYVLELSGFQLGRIERLDADAAALLNMAPDHPERHDGMEGDTAAMPRIFRDLGGGARAVIGVDDALTEQICTDISGSSLAVRGVRIEPVSVGKVLGHGVYVLGGVLYEAGPARTRRIVELTSTPALQARHDWQNAAAAWACAAAFVPDREALAQGLTTFRGPERGQEPAAARGAFADDFYPARGAA